MDARVFPAASSIEDFNDDAGITASSKSAGARSILGVTGRVPRPFGNSLTALNCNCSARWLAGWGPRKNRDSSVSCNSSDHGSCLCRDAAARQRVTIPFFFRRVNKFHRRADRMPGGPRCSTAAAAARGAPASQEAFHRLVCPRA